MPPPANVVQREICALSGMTANPRCPIRRNEWVPTEASSLPCSWHHHGRREFQTLPLRAVTGARASIEWSVAGKIVGSADVNPALDWALIPGEHGIMARDGQGQTEATVVVR
jgi:Penicillin-Binding Protein C-terminus Family